MEYLVLKCVAQTSAKHNPLGEVGNVFYFRFLNVHEWLELVQLFYFSLDHSQTYQ